MKRYSAKLVTYRVLFILFIYFLRYLQRWSTRENPVKEEVMIMSHDHDMTHWIMSFSEVMKAWSWLVTCKVFGSGHDLDLKSNIEVDSSTYVTFIRRILTLDEGKTMVLNLCLPISVLGRKLFLTTDFGPYYYLISVVVHIASWRLIRWPEV